MAFRGRKVVVVGREAQIVDEEDELQWVRRQLVHQIGDLIKLVLLDFHEAQAVGSELVGDGLDGAGLARTGVAVEQDIVGRHPGQQGAGVGDDLPPAPARSPAARRGAGGRGSAPAPAGRSRP